MFFREWLYSIYNDSKISFMNGKSIFRLLFSYILCFTNINTESHLPFCHPIVCEFVSFFSCFQCQLLLQLLSIIICQKALLFWSSHLFQMINACTEQQSYLKTTSVTSTRSLKLWWLLIPNLYFIIVSHLLNHNRNFFFKSLWWGML